MARDALERPLLEVREIEEVNYMNFGQRKPVDVRKQVDRQAWRKQGTIKQRGTSVMTLSPIRVTTRTPCTLTMQT